MTDTEDNFQGLLHQHLDANARSLVGRVRNNEDPECA